MSNLFNKKKDIINWLEKYEVKNYTLIKDREYGYVVDVEGYVNLYDKKLSKIKVKFNHIQGHFLCGLNKLQSLEGAPNIVDGNFYCEHNQIISLEGSPKEVFGNFYCSYNKLTSLQGSPQIIKGNFVCNNNQLNSLKGAPQEVGKKFYCHNNPQLGIYQKMTNFNEIKTLLEKDNLSNNLIIPEIHSIIHKL